MVALTVSTQVDDASIRKSAVDIQRRYERIGQEVGGDFMSAFANGARSNSPKLEKAMDGARDATGKLRVEQEKLDDLLARGDTNRTKLIQQSERTAKAKRDEERAIRQAAAAYKDYEGAGDSAGGAFLAGLRAGMGQYAGIGSEAADRFSGGLTGGLSAARMAGAGSVAGAALGAGLVAAAVGAVAVLGPAIADGLQTIRMEDQFQASMGLDESSMSQYANAAGRAYAGNFGASVQDNLGAAQTALRAGLIDPSDTSNQVQAVVEQLQGLTRTTEATAAESSRSISTLMRTGLAGSVSEASDIITAGFQSGLDVSGDWLDTINEYSTQFRKFGLDAGEVMTLLKQGLEGGARDTDKVADSLKEFSIRAVDGSKSTKEGFEALGFSAEDMSRRFAAGGDSAHTALGSVFDALKRIDDPMQKALIWQRLFGTQFEDMGDAINRFNLDPAAAQFRDLQGTSDRATKTATDNFTSNWETATRTVGQAFSDLKTNIAEWFSDLPVIRDIPEWITTAFTPSGTHQPGWFDPNLKPNPEATGNMLLPPELRVTPPAGPAPAGPPPGAPKRPDGPLGELWDAQFGPNPSAIPTAGPDVPQQGAPKPIPVVPEDGAGGKSKPSFDPSKWTLESIPFGSFPGEEGLASGAPAPSPMVPGTGPGSFQVDPQRVFDAQTSQINAQTSLQNARYRYLEVMADADATEQDRYNAKAALVAQGRSLQSAEAKLAEAQQGTWKKMESTANAFSQGMDKVGATLDADLGLGEGISGFVENLIKAAGNLAAAPMLTQLDAISKANPIQGGYGMFGMYGAQNIAAGKSPLGFGSSGYAYPSALGPAALQYGIPTNIGMPSLLNDTGSVPSGPQSRFAAAVVQQMWGDQLRGKIGGSRDNNTAKGTHDAGLSIDIPIGPDQMALGDEINAYLQAHAQELGLEYSIWRDQGKYPGGGGFTQSGHQNHIDAKFNGAAVPYSSGNVAAPAGNFSGFGSPGSPQAIANMIYQQAVGRGYSPHEAQSIVAYAIGESNLNPGSSPGAQGGSGFENGVVGLFQQKPDFARRGGIDPSQRSDPVANTYAYLNQLEANRNLPIEQALPATSIGGPLASGPGAQPQAWAPLMAQAGNLLGFGSGGAPAVAPTAVAPATAPFAFPAGGGGGGGLLPGMGMPQAAPFAAPSVIPGQSPAGPPGTGGGFSGLAGGLTGAAMSAGAAGLDMLAPGAGQAAQTGIQLANRTIGFLGQLGGIAAGGVLETLSVGGGNPLADPMKTLPGRVLAGIAGARPALPNQAGQGQQQAQQQNGQGAPGQQGQGGQQPSGPLVEIHGGIHQAPNQTPDSVANGMANQLRSAELAGGFKR
ncbi:phage tail tape measure protein [Mycolicibacterium fortuitum]|uniref:phage tail tape measure protein n=1 Tax=Mycolicibacterium fortuitum TaxID=1766 RepID=UPI00096C9297|nr:phage tail tape measure protein [Mycolicibacterium fortuitum]OMC02178.1 hypothetical protein A5734_15040 [Mycolicibacterium fortuitum]